MSDCCLPNLGCLSIPVVSTNVAGNPGATGAAGNGIASESYDPLTGELELTFTDSTTFTTGDLRGAQGDPGVAGVNGVSRLYTNIFTGTSTSATIDTWESMATYTLAGGSLLNVGDSVVISFETELLLANTTRVLLGRSTVVPPLRRVSIASGATSLTRYGSTSSQEPMMDTLSNILGVIYSYRTTVELIKVSSSNITNNFMRRCRVDNTIPSQPSSYSNGAGTLLSINVNNPIVFSFDIYQYQSTEMRIKNATIDKITAVTP
jgi:hypothetical protein